MVTLGLRIEGQLRARMAELADAQVSEACGRNPVEVQVLFRAPLHLEFPGSLDSTHFVYTD